MQQESPEMSKYENLDLNKLHLTKSYCCNLKYLPILSNRKLLPS